MGRHSCVGTRASVLRCLQALALLFCAISAISLINCQTAAADSSLWGPVVDGTNKHTASEHVPPDAVQTPDVVAAQDDEHTTTVALDTAAVVDDSAEGDPPPEPVKKETIAEILDSALEKEFKVEEVAASTKTHLNETLTKGTMEYVVKVSKKKHTEEAPGGAAADDAAGGSDSAFPATTHATADQWDLDPDGTDGMNDVAADSSESLEQDVDRLIDSEQNEYVLSRSKAGVTLTLDPLLIQDLTVVLSASSIFGALFEAIRQPVINGYILAGSLVGPGGLGLVKEMVQVESLAQVGVQLLLFGLGMEFSAEKLRVVGPVAVLGGLAEIGLFVAVAAAGALAIGGAVSEGIFVGALVSMSSTSVVVKALGTGGKSPAAQIVIGTLILQDCSVGLMFALMPVLSSLNDPTSDLDPEATGAIVLLILKVLLKLVAILSATVLLGRTIVPAFLSRLHRRFSDELFQMTIVAFCMSCAWFCGWTGLSHELGAFLGGIMLSTMDQHETVLKATEQVRNVFTGLFLASIGLIISPRFIWDHIVLLSLGASFVLVIKAALITLVVWNFRYPLNTSLMVGLSLAQVGEFAFVLLSMASQLGLVTNRLAMLLLGVTAISLMTTPFILKVSHHMLDYEAPSSAALPLAAEQVHDPKGTPVAEPHRGGSNGHHGEFNGRSRPARTVTDTTSIVMTAHTMGHKQRHARPPQQGDDPQ